MNNSIDPVIKLIYWLYAHQEELCMVCLPREARLVSAAQMYWQKIQLTILNPYETNIARQAYNFLREHSTYDSI